MASITSGCTPALLSLAKLRLALVRACGIRNQSSRERPKASKAEGNIENSLWCDVGIHCMQRALGYTWDQTIESRTTLMPRKRILIPSPLAWSTAWTKTPVVSHPPLPVVPERGGTQL